MHVRPLDADMDDAKRTVGFERELAPCDRERRLAQRAVELPLAQAANVSHDTEHDVRRRVPIDLRPALVRRPRAFALRLAAGPGALAATSVRARFPTRREHVQLRCSLRHDAVIGEDTHPRQLNFAIFWL